MTEHVSTPTRRVPWQPLVLLVLFAGPLVASLTLYYGFDWRPGGTTNHGELIQPPVTLPEVSAPLLDGDRTDPDFLRGLWTLLYVSPGACTDACQEALARTQQVRALHGRRAIRIQRVLMTPRDGVDAAALDTDHQDLITVVTDDDAAAPMVELLQPLVDGNSVLLVDPLGNVMERFSLDDDSKGMYEDLKKLLKISRIG